MHKEKEENGMLSHMHHHDTYRSRELGVFENGLLDGEMFLQVSCILTNRTLKRKQKNKIKNGERNALN